MLGLARSLRNSGVAEIEPIAGIQILAVVNDDLQQAIVFAPGERHVYSHENVFAPAPPARRYLDRWLYTSRSVGAKFQHMK